MKNLVILIAILHISITSFAQTPEDNLKAVENFKLELIQKLFSCHSMAYTIIAERDLETRYIFLRIGSKYSEDAASALNSIRNLKGNLSEKQYLSSSKLIEFYSTIFVDINGFDKPGSVLALSFAKSGLRKLSKDLQSGP